jgi:peptidoglycan/LPS O-acetylase OafA/YrhL
MQIAGNTRFDRDGLILLGLLLFGLPSLLLGLAMAFAPSAFFELVGPYGVRNDHYIHDTASFQVALAVMLLAGLFRPRWRVPALIANAIQWGLHSISHLIDIANADPTWIGYLDALVLPAGTALLVLLAVSASRQERSEETTWRIEDITGNRVIP